MKAKMILASAALLAATLARTTAADGLPTGTWQVTFDNGVVQHCQFLASGKVTVVQAQRTADGTAEAKRDAIEVAYEDDRFERWTREGSKMQVEHWHPASAASERPGITGNAQKLLPPGWNDRVSSVQVGGNVTLIGYQHANFEGASVTFKGGGNYPNLVEVNSGLGGGANWNDRISSVRVVRGDDPELTSEADNQATLFRGADYQAGSLALEAGTEIPDLAASEDQVIRAALRVHEWGTFTILQGSNGQAVQWYQAPEYIVDLPPFVRSVSRRLKSGINSAGGKALAGMDTVRMETPVLYFYPEQQMDVTVSASYPQGRITEVFPPVLHSNGSETVWRGTLLPPDSPELAKVPAVEGAKGRHYGAARAVPDAWLFRNKPQPNRKPSPAELAMAAARKAQGLPPAPKVEPIDHFIFYRGAGTGTEFLIRAVQSSNDPRTYTLHNTGAPVAKLFALRVSEGLTSWTQITDLKTEAWDREQRKHINRQTFTFPEPAGPVGTVAETIREEMVASLHAEGLTKAEAEAMVATWDNLWFTEPGTRILAILPQSVADAMVPLKITPVPEKIERVFVARLELITRQQEEILTAVLNSPAQSGETKAQSELAALEKFDSLQLGRYSAGGMERARILVSNQIYHRFHQLEQVRRDRDKRARELEQKKALETATAAK